jgi:hypothetical protein
MATALAVSVALSRAGGQSLSSEEAAHSGIVLTPIGALPRVSRADLQPDSAARLQLQARYGSWKSVTGSGSAQFQNVGATAMYQLRRRLSLGGTFGYRSCGGCDGLYLAGLDAEASVFHQTNERRGEGFVDVALQGSAGYGRARTAPIRATSLGLWLPVSVSLPESNGSLVTLALAPGVAYGYLTDNGGDVLGYVGSDGGVRAMFSAGAAYRFAGPLALHVVFSRIMLDKSPTHFGLAVSWRAGARNDGS